MAATTIDAYFEGKPGTRAQFDVVAAEIAALGPVKLTIASQISFGAGRKFAWCWLYNVTGKTPEGVLHLTLALDHQEPSDHVRSIDRVGKNRWNHQIVLRTDADVHSAWLRRLLAQAYAYGTGGDRTQKSPRKRAE